VTKKTYWKGWAFGAIVTTTASSALMTVTLSGVASACNTGVFARPTNPGVAVCECTCGTGLEPDAGDLCIAACQAPFDSQEEVARAAGCGSTYNAYTECLVFEGTCVDKSFDAPTCGSEQAALSTCEVTSGGG
jgi:hypothetical protein